MRRTQSFRSVGTFFRLSDGHFRIAAGGKAESRSRASMRADDPDCVKTQRLL